MKHWMIVLLAVMVAGSVSAQRRGRASAGEGESSEPKLIRIVEVSEIRSPGQYEQTGTPGSGEIKTTVKRNETWKNTKTTVRGWHAFEAAYEVKKELPPRPGQPSHVFMLPEVEVEVAVLYDMGKSQMLPEAYRKAGAIGYTKGTRYALLVETFTYQNIFADFDHYVATLVPPTFAVAYGQPIAVSFAISYDGELQDIKTSIAGKAGVMDPEKKKTISIQEVVYNKGANGKMIPKKWWEDLSSNSMVMPFRGVLRDRSQTPFALSDIDAYDMLKQK